jgi:hypothetical protein
MLVNAPILRTLVYVQVNLHTLNLVLLSLLLYPKQPLLSAFTLAAAVHLKASPAVLALAFLLEKDWRWLTWFIISMLLLAGITVATDGISPFFDVLHHLQGLALSQNMIFHDTSFDSFLRFTDRLLGIDIFWTRILVYLAKGLLAVATLLVMVKCMQGQIFLKSEGRGAKLFNAIPPLFIPMTLTSPVVWEHHGVFVALSFLLMLKCIEQPAEWLWFGFAYFLQFVLPTFDFFPWSYGRLVAPLIILWMMWQSKKRKEPAPLFNEINSWLDQLPLTKRTVS